MHLLESVVRDALDPAAPRAFAVRRPLRVALANPEDIPALLAAAHPIGCEPQEAGCEPQDGAARVAADAAAGVLGWVSVRNHPKRPELGSRRVPLAAELFIERDDVRADAGGAEPSSVPKRQRFFPPPPSSRAKWTRRVPHPVLIGHAASLSQVLRAHAAAARRAARHPGMCPPPAVPAPRRPAVSPLFPGFHPCPARRGGVAKVMRLRPCVIGAGRHRRAPPSAAERRARAGSWYSRSRRWSAALAVRWAS